MAHIDAIEDADSYFDKLAKENEAQAAAERLMAIEFMAACGKCDANALADFVPTVTDWDLIRAYPVAIGDMKPQRRQTLTEVMQDSLDYRNGPALSELMQLLLNVAFGKDLDKQRTLASNLLCDMASKYAEMNAEASE